MATQVAVTDVVLGMSFDDLFAMSEPKAKRASAASEPKLTAAKAIRNILEASPAYLGKVILIADPIPNHSREYKDRANDYTDAIQRDGPSNWVGFWHQKASAIMFVYTPFESVLNNSKARTWAKDRNNWRKSADDAANRPHGDHNLTVTPAEIADAKLAAELAQMKTD